MKKKYRSKIGFIAFLPFLIILFPMSFSFLLGLSFFTTIIITSALFCLFLYSPFFFPHYTIDGNLLCIKYGNLLYVLSSVLLYGSAFRKIKIDINKIRKIKERNVVFSVDSVAASLDRIEITYNKYDRIMLSPKNKHEFIQDLMSINPDIEVIYKEKKN